MWTHPAARGHRGDGRESRAARDAAAPPRRAAVGPRRVAARDESAPPRRAAPRDDATARRAAPSHSTAAPRWAAPRDELTGRRTVTITGRGAERYDPQFRDRVRQRPRRPAHARSGFRPDRMALWAVLLGIVLILVAATSSHAAALTPRTAATASNLAALAAPATVPHVAAAGARLSHRQ